MTSLLLLKIIDLLTCYLARCVMSTVPDSLGPKTINNFVEVVLGSSFYLPHFVEVWCSEAVLQYFLEDLCSEAVLPHVLRLCGDGKDKISGIPANISCWCFGR
jgi:hypothetical protein